MASDLPRMPHRYRITSTLDPVVTLTLATKAEAFAAARGLASGDGRPVLVEDRMARRGCESRWRVAPHDRAVRTLERKER
jgi:hypothetical protein